MKLSKETLTVLKNFASINDGIVFRSGNILRTCDTQKQIMAETKISEDIPSNFAIFDLNRFLSVLSLHDDNTEIELDSDSKAANLKSGRKRTIYRLCSIEMIKNAPDKTSVMPSVDVSFTLSADDLDTILRSASVLGSPHIAVKSDGTKIVVAQLDSKNSSAHSSEIEVADGNSKKYNMIFKTENLRMIPGSYVVSISFRGIANFKHTEKDIQYWVATDVGSTNE
jgi:hypothetical protein